MTLDDQIKSVGREIGMRRNVYPNFVRKGSLTQEKADHELAAMEEVYKTLKGLKTAPDAAPQSFLAPLVERAAEILEQYAEEIRASCNNDGRATFTCEGCPAGHDVCKRDYDEIVRCAAAARASLKAAAPDPETTQPNPAASISSTSTEAAKKDTALNPAASWPFPKGPRP